MDNNRFHPRVFHKNNSRGRFHLKSVTHEYESINVHVMPEISEQYSVFPG